MLLRSAGYCENPNCAGQPEDCTDVGDPILEIDHIHDLARGGPDDPSQMIALYPSCHAIKTRGRTREELRQVLFVVARHRHDALSEPWMTAAASLGPAGGQFDGERGVTCRTAAAGDGP